MRRLTAGAESRESLEEIVKLKAGRMTNAYMNQVFWDTFYQGIPKEQIKKQKLSHQCWALDEGHSIYRAKPRDLKPQRSFFGQELLDQFKRLDMRFGKGRAT